MSGCQQLLCVQWLSSCLVPKAGHTSVQILALPLTGCAKLTQFADSSGVFVSLSINWRVSNSEKYWQDDRRTGKYKTTHTVLAQSIRADLPLRKDMEKCFANSRDQCQFMITAFVTDTLAPRERDFCCICPQLHLQRPGRCLASSRRSGVFVAPMNECPQPRSKHRLRTQQAEMRRRIGSCCPIGAPPPGTSLPAPAPKHGNAALAASLLRLKPRRLLQPSCRPIPAPSTRVPVTTPTRGLFWI